MVSELQRIVTYIPARPVEERNALKRKLQVAAYCRVSTEEEEQQSSYEIQCSTYTEKIMTNPDWTMAGIFADEGITGTSTKKRDDFNRMIRKCKRGKIDLILTKSISRFARNTLDTINYTRMLRAMGIGVYFDKEDTYTTVSFNNTIYCGYLALSLTTYRVSFSIFKRLLIGLSDK